jgi:hypothetical protein
MGQGDCQFGPRLSKPQRVRACTALQFNKVARVLFGLLRFGEPRCGSDSIHLVASPLVFLWLVCLIPLLVSCETQPHLVLDTVGPPSASVGSSGLDFAGIGFLRVYSATETRNADKFITYYPHTPYTIYTTNGQLFRWERNSVTTADENPALVRLPSGLYTVRAQDDGYGRVIVPVLIKGGETTTIHLDARRLAPTEHLNPTNAVRLPNGRLVGWRAREPMGPSGL